MELFYERFIPLLSVLNEFSVISNLYVRSKKILITEIGHLVGGWNQIAFEVYKGHPISALTLAYQLTALKECVQSDVAEATAAIDRAIDALYEQSDFRQVSHALFRATVEGKLPTDKEHILRLLGINT